MLNQPLDAVIGAVAFIAAVVLAVKPFVALRTYWCYPEMDPNAVPHYGFWTNLFQIWVAYLVPGNLSFFMLMNAMSDKAAYYLWQPFVVVLAVSPVALMAYFFSRLRYEQKHPEVSRQLELAGTGR